jgi:AraC family transcriptional regulator, transcriptional activator of pobA
MREPLVPKVIRSYGLFGETANLPDPMHIETIAARSALHDWELAPHRHARLHQLLLLRSGSGTLHLEGRALNLPAMSLVNVPPGAVHAFAFERDTQGWVATLADDLLEQLLAPAGEERQALATCGVIAADAALGTLMAQIAVEFEGRSPSRSLVLRGLCAVLLGLAARAATRAAPPDRDSAGSALLRRFEALVQARALEHWSVADYARALAVTPTHLSRVVRLATGQPASRLVEARLMREARRQLAYTSLQVTTIAYTLGFADPAYFSRVFSRVEGLSPRAFRARLSALPASAAAPSGRSQAPPIRG